jgi:hypothetical protein
VLYELTTGKLPFDADTPLAVALKHVQEKLPPPSSVYPEISSLIEAIIVKAMEKDPAQRYQSVDFLLADLRKFSHKVRTTKIPTARLSVEAMPAGEYTDENLLLVSPEVGEEVQVSIHFVDTGQILNLERGREYTIGRRHRTQAVIPDIDLTPFKGYEWGISRLHAKVDLTQEDVKITDLGSSNGTWYDGKQIPKDTPYVLHHGDVVNLGKLRLQVLISN